MKKSLFILCGLFLSINLYAQQDAQSGVYMFNPLDFNPAYAGSRGAFNATLVHRSQWLGGFHGSAPITQFLSFHTPFARNSMGAGMHINNDALGKTGRLSAFGDVSFSLTLDSKRKHRLNLGLSAGVDIMNINYKDLVGDDGDPFKINASQTNFNAGAGLYYYSKNAYFGFSVPRIIPTEWVMGTTATLVKKHYFIAAGWVKPINSVIDFKLSTLIKLAPPAPPTFDLNANLFFYKAFWVGSMFRWKESFGINIAYQFQEKWMFGYQYEFVFNGIRNASKGGNHEIMLTYDMNGRRSVYASPRYF